MKTRNLIYTLALFFNIVIAYHLNAQNALSTIDNTEAYSSMDIIYMDKNLSVFANLLNLSGLSISLAFVDNDHTLFVPSNEAFADMSIEKFAELTNPNNRVMLTDFVTRHFVKSKLHSFDIKEADVLDLDNDKTIEIYNGPDTITVGGANIINADIDTKNGVMHILNNYISVNN